MDGEKPKSVTELQDLGTGAPSPNDVVNKVADQYGQDATHLHKQTRTRRLFSTAQLVGLTMVSMGTWTGVLGSIYAALMNGGVFGWLFGYIVVSVGIMALVVTFCEMASVQPVAGAQYYWTHFLAPQRTKLFLTWIQGWTTWFSYVAGLASYINAISLMLLGAVDIGHPGIEFTGWQVTLIILAVLAFITVLNLYCFRIIPWFELIVGVLNILVFFIEMVVIWVVAPRNNPSVFLDKTDGNSGWNNYFLQFNIGCLSMVWLFNGFESPIHLGEETRNPQKAVPRALFWGMTASIIMGFVMIFTFGMAMPSIEYMLNAWYPTPALLIHATKSVPATLALLSFHITRGIAGIVGALSTASRVTWAWSRDGGLPSYFAIVDAKTRIPFRAVYGTSGVIALLLLLNLNDEAKVAFTALCSLGTLSLYVSYIVFIGCLIYARFTGIFKPGVWNVGRWGLYINIFAITYAIYEAIWLPFPTSIPVTAQNMNYAGPVFGAVLLLALTHWFMWARKNWTGPNRAVVDIVLQHDEASRFMKERGG